MIQISYESDNAAQKSHGSSAELANRNPDGVHDFMLVLSDIYAIFPDLWQNPALRYSIFYKNAPILAVFWTMTYGVWL